MRKRFHAAAVVLLLGGCGAPPARPPATRSAPAARLPALPPGVTYRIDSAHSELRLLVYRAGVMAAFGHDHVIVNRALEGWINRGDSPTGSAFFLSIPAAAFAVDEAAPRAQEGADFSQAVGEDAKAGTLRNMLSPALLDAESHPSITVQSISIEPAALDAQARVRIRVAGHESSLAVPFTFDTSPGRLHAQAAFTLRQSALGLAPFTALMGALRVADEVRVKLDLIALRN